MSWINGGSKKIAEQNPLTIQQATVGDVIECTGWWKAEDYLPAQWRSAFGGDNNYYINQWDDSSGNFNHLVEDSPGRTEGRGPQPYGSGTNDWGDSSDELNGYTALNFTDVADVSSTSIVTITDFAELNTGDKVNLIATDTTNYDFVCGDQSSVNGTWEATTSNEVTATNLMNVINTSSGPAGTRFTATVLGAVVTVTQATVGTGGDTTVTLTDSGTVGMTKTDFTGGITGQEQGQTYLICTPSVADDFKATASTHLNWLVVARHHYDGLPTSLEGFTSGMENSTAHFVSSYNSSSDYWLMGIGNTSPSAHAPVFNATRNGTSGTHSEILDGMNAVANVYQVAGFFGTTTSGGSGWGVTGFNSSGYPLVQKTGDSSTIEVAGNTNGKIYVGSGDSSFDSSRDFEGRIVEMACWKSDNPISVYNRAAVIQYFRNKFAL